MLATMPQGEKMRFESLLIGYAERFNLEPEDYLRKIWYHQVAAQLGEYVAMVLLEQLLPLAPPRGLREAAEAESRASVT